MGQYLPNQLVLVPWVLSGICFLCLLIVILMSFVAKKEKTRTLVFRWACLLALLLPMAVALLMVFFAHDKRDGVFDAISALHEGRLLPFSRGVSDYKTYMILGGLALGGSALLGFVGVFVSWLRLRRVHMVSKLSLLAFGAMAFAELVIAAGIVFHYIAIIDMFSAMGFGECAEEAVLLKKGYAGVISVMPFLFAAIAGVAIGCLAIVGVTAAGKGTHFRMGKGSVAASVIVFLFGLSLFVATRGHAEDAASIPKLFQMEPNCGELLRVEREIKLPDLKNTQRLKSAPFIEIGDGQIVADGKTVGRIDDIMADEYPEIFDLTEILGNLKSSFEHLHPEMDFPGRITLQCDKDVQGQVVAKVLLNCYRVGYQKIQIVTKGFLKITTAVNGDYVRIYPKAVHFEMTDRQDEIFLALLSKEKFGQWATKLDEAVARGKVQVRLPLPIYAPSVPGR